MPIAKDHPNEPGRWTLLERRAAASLWRRERSDPAPVTMFYVLRPPRQAQILYDETRARELFESVPPDADAPAR